MMDCIIYMLKVGFGQLVFFGLYWFLLRQLTFFKLNRLFLLACLFVPLLLPFITIPSLVVLPNGLIEVWSEGVEIVLGESQSQQYNLLNWIFITGFVYVMGFLFSSTVFGYKLLNIFRLIKNNPGENFNNYCWIKVEEIGIASFFNYLFAPSNFIELENHQSILEHEAIHMNQKHSIDVLFAEVLQIVFWFNPIVYFIKKAILLNHEYLADKGAINKITDQKPYIKLLINNNLDQQLQLSNAFFNSQLKNRITMLQQKKSSPIFKVQYLSILLAIFGVLFMFSCEPESVNNKSYFPIVDDVEIEQTDGSTQNTNPDVFVIVEDMPEFIGGEQKMLEYLYTNITYPAIARDGDIQGLCVVSFVVQEDGSLINVVIRRDIGGGCGEEAARVVKSMPKWKPGKQKGKTVKVSYNLPVRFKLS